MRWTRATPAGRVIGAALAFDAKAQVVPDPEAPPEPEPGPDPEPPEPEPPSPPTEGLEPPVAGATHVGLKVGPARQTITAIGFGLGSPGGQSPAKTLEKHTKVLVKDPGANSIRLNGPSTAYVDSCKVLADAGIKLVHVTSYENNLTTNPVGSAKSVRQRGHAAAGQGRQGHQRSAAATNLRYRLWGGDKARAIHKAYRDELDRQGLQKIVLVSPEFANTDSWSHDCARDLKGMMGKEIGAWGCHSYGLGLDEKLSQLVLPQGIAFVQHESGYGSWTSTCAKILNDRNRGCAGWDFHRAHQTQPDGDLSQSLIAYSGAPTGHYYAWLRIALTLPLGTRIHQVTRKSGEWRRRRTHAFQADVLEHGLRRGRETLGRPLGDLRDEQRRRQAAGAGRAAREAERGVPRRDRERGQSSGGSGVDEGRAAADASVGQGRPAGGGGVMALGVVLMLVGALIFAVAVRRG